MRNSLEVPRRNGARPTGPQGLRPRRHYRTIFISDTHLGTRGCKADLLADFLTHNDCRTLYLVGDIIDGWRLKKNWFWNPAHSAVVTATTAPSVSDQNFADQLATFIQGNYAALLSTLATFWGVSVQAVPPTAPSPPANSAGAPVPGTAAGDMLPSQTSGIITLRTAAIGRRNRGRVYVPFPAEADSSPQGRPTVGYIGRLGNLAAQLTLPLTIAAGGGTAIVEPVIYHRLDTPPTSTFITAAVARPLWATQRRRGDYGRPNPPPW